MTLILGIETSCDETAAAVVERGPDGALHLRANVIASQIEVHRQYGGVFPEVASRMHVEAIAPVVAEALSRAAVEPERLDAIAVTHGPGLAGSLLVGVNYAKGLCLSWDKPLVGVNHLEGHVYSLWLTEYAPRIRFPVLCLVTSGGHSELILMSDHGQYRLLGSTLDDAAGEAFDKVGRLLGLPYPGGPSIQRAAQDGDPARYPFTRAALGPEHPYDFSFSGLKTAVMRAVQPPVTGRRTRGDESMSPDQRRPDVNIADVAAGFQSAAVDMLVDTTARAAADHNVTAVLLAGGVSANALLRETMRSRLALPVYYPPLALCTDNAAMIAAAGCFLFARGVRHGLALDVRPMYPLASAGDEDTAFHPSRDL
ncbi:MAG: tRNA (adenosine(37)-N6)-threonylcarbamoyltransferase complex transferase subunit TsaD [Anaerolineae bacterium]|nr:tRNA (adenosine(37)-N6)-threonylcarbamoyltransferase complex transferase subunit TsaD [Anaerolineae bacterium]